MTKYDLLDGFYWMFLDPADSLKLSVLMPRYEAEPQLVTILLSTMMGWVSSPPTFCTASKTMVDLANVSLYKCMVPSHRLEDAASLHDSWEPSQPIHLGKEPSSPNTGGLLATLSPLADDRSPALGGEASCSDNHGPLTAPSPLADDRTLAQLRPLLQPGDRAPLQILLGPVVHVDVFVDNFIGLAQGSWCQCCNIRHCIMHAVDQVFAQRDVNTMHHKEAISEKKLGKGDKGWNQWKEILGWMLDSKWKTLELTE